MAQLMVFGSARVDAFLDIPIDKVDKLCNLDTHRCVIEFTYGAKIPLNGVSFLLGGNGANVAIGTKRLGVESSLVAELGEGAMSNLAMDTLKAEIDTTYVTQTKGIAEGFGAVIMYQGERTILSYYPPMQPKFPDNVCGTPWAYLTSTGEDFVDYYEKIYQWLDDCHAKLVFNPGGRQIAKGLPWLKKYLEKTELLFVNREEGEEITGVKDTQGKEKDLLDALHQTGARKVVVTDGSNGAFAKSDDRYMRIKAMPIDAYERTGAGDSFSSGCMSALILGKELEEGLLWGTLNSASKIGYLGPQKGLLKSEQLPEWVQRAKSSGVQVENL